MAPTTVHSFRLEATFGPEEVFRALRAVCEDGSRKNAAPAFEFEWIQRRIAFSAATREAAEDCVVAFLRLVQQYGGSDEAFLVGKPEEKDGRTVWPIGVALHDAATFGELIGRSLVEAGLRGIQVIDSMGVCRIVIRKTGLPVPIDFASFLGDFPLPAYIRLVDEGEKQTDGANKPPKKKRNRR